MENMETEKNFIELQDFAQLLAHFVQEYEKKPSEQSDSDWLKAQFLREIAGLTENAADALSQEAADTIRAYDQNLASLMDAKSQGKTAQEWFAEKAAVSGMSVEKLGELHTALEQANSQLMRVIDPKVELLPVTNPNWTNCDSRLIAKSLGEQAVLAGIQSAAATAGYRLSEGLTGEIPLDMQGIVASALETGMDTGLKTVTAAALKVASEQRLLVPENAAMREVTDLACTTIENVKTLQTVADGARTAGEALDQLGRNAAAMYFDLSFSEAGRVIGRTALSWIPAVGPMVGEVVGYTVGRMLDSKAGEKIRQAAGRVAETATKAVRTVWTKAKETAVKAKKAIKSFAKSLFH